MVLSDLKILLSVGFVPGGGSCGGGGAVMIVLICQCGRVHIL